MSIRFRIYVGLALLLLQGVHIEAATVKGQDPDETRLLNAKTIRIPVEGCITTSFVHVYAMLQSTNFLGRIQAAYEAQLPLGEKPEFTVMPAGDGRYYYVNKNHERCDIREVWRTTDSNTTFHCAFYVTGERFFGRFESLITVHVKQASIQPVETMWYETDIRIRPQCAVIRFFLQTVPGVEYYFRKKTAEMRQIISSVVLHLTDHIAVLSHYAAAEDS